jgi:hypothetical protein
MVSGDLEFYKSRETGWQSSVIPSPSTTMQFFTKSSFATLALLLLTVNVAEAMPTQNADNEQATCLPLGSE